MLRHVLWVMLLLGCSEQKDVLKINFSGTVEITEHVLAAKVPGRITLMNVTEGNKVTKGQLLLTLDRYEQQHKELERIRALQASGGASMQQVELAQLALDDQAVIAPIDGVVLVKTVEEGEVVGAGAGLVVLGDITDQWVRLYVPQGLVNQIQMNQEVVVQADGIKDPIKARVSFISIKPEFTPRNVQTPEERVTQAFMVKVKIENPDLRIRPGTGASVKFLKI